MRPTTHLEADERALFGDARASEPPPDCYEIDAAFQGQEGLEMVLRAATTRRSCRA